MFHFWTKKTNITDLKLESLNGDSFETETLRNKVVLIVNVASHCGFTGQYAGLQRLYETFRSQGLIVIGVPCNQFGNQEPGNVEEIAKFCDINFGVTFPLLAKQNVNGPSRSALYSVLVNSKVGAGRDIFWNFEKFIADRQGHVIARFVSEAEPESNELIQVIKEALAV